MLKLLAISCELQKEAHDMEKAIGHQRLFPSPIHQLLPQLNGARVSKSFPVSYIGKRMKKKSRNAWFAPEFSVTVSHCVHCLTRAFHNAESSVQVPFQTQAGV